MYRLQEGDLTVTNYFVNAIWDEEAEVYISETNVPGLNVEAATLPEFMEIAASFAGELISANTVGQPVKEHPTAKLQLAYA